MGGVGCPHSSLFPPKGPSPSSSPLPGSLGLSQVGFLGRRHGKGREKKGTAGGHCGTPSPRWRPHTAPHLPRPYGHDGPFPKNLLVKGSLGRGAPLRSP